MADFLDRYVKKGRKVYVEGQLQTRKWTDREGIERYTTEVVVGAFKGDVVALDAGPRDGEEGTRSGSGGEGYGRGRSDTRSRPGNVQGSLSGGAGGYQPSGGDMDDEIPF